MRKREVIEAGDVPEGKRETRGGLAVRPVERAVLGGVLIDAHIDVKGALDVGHSPRYLHVEAIRGGAGYGEAILPGEIDHRVTVCLRRPELLRELFHGEELPVVRTSGIVDIRQELIQLVLIAQRQRDHQIHVLA